MSKVLLITGASSGIGEATARKAAQEGLKLILTARRKDKLDALVEEFGSDNAVGIAADAGNYDELEQAVKARCEITDISEEHARTILLRNLTQDAGGHYFWASDPKLRTRSSIRLTEGQAKALMENIRCPVLFIAASDSFKKVSDVFETRQSWFSRANCEQFVGGHHIHMEKPEEVGAAIRDFVEQL